MEKIARPGMTVLDIGANIGYYALMELGLIGDSGKLITVEPSPKNIEIFKMNLELNSKSGIRVIEGAVSDKSEKKDFHPAEQGNLNTFHATGTGLKHLTGEVVEVNSYTVPQVMEGEGQLDLIRMDVEGHECEIISGMLKYIENGYFKPHICFEPHITSYSKNNKFS